MHKILVIPILFLAFLLIQCSPESEEHKEKDSTEEQGEVIEEEGGENPDEGEEGGQEESEPKEGYSRASFNFTGEFSEQKSALNKTEEADLFALQFYDVETQNPYAFVIGDDISQITVDFRTGRTYMLKITYIKDGQNVVFTNGYLGSPFTNSGYIDPEWNEPFYSSEIFLNSISSPFIHLKDGSGSLYVEAERYHGVIENFEITEENNELTVPLQSLFFGVNLNIDMSGSNLETISFAIHSTYYAPRRYSVALTEGKGNLEIPFLSLGFPPEQNQGAKYLNTLDMAVLQEYQEDVHFSIGTPENEILFFDDFVTVERNKKVIIDLLSADTSETSNGGFTLNFGEEMLDQYIDLNAQ